MSSSKHFQFRIRQALPKDARQIELLAHACILDLAGTSHGRIVPIMSERIKVDLKLYPKTCLVAHDGRRLVGFSLTEVTGSSAYILLLAVDPEYRRRSVGSALVSDTIYRLEEEGVEYVELMTPSENKPAQSFWIRSGFADDKMRVFSRFLIHHDS